MADEGLKLKRKLEAAVAKATFQFADAHSATRDYLIEKPEFYDALLEFDQKNYSAAFDILMDLADKGDAAAQYNLGIFCEIGMGVPVRRDEPAELCYRYAAEQGLPESQFQLAAILAADVMADEDSYRVEEAEERFIEAYMWLLLAERGFRERANVGVQKLEYEMAERQRIFTSTLDAFPRLEQHMTEGQLEEAENRARQWEATHQTS
jgi:TPR repeat protein